MRTPLVLLSAGVLALAGCSSTNEAGFQSDGSCDGVVVEVNFGELGERIEECVSINGTTEVAKDVLSQAGVSVEGTKEYGDAVVCRVNQFPSATDPIQIEGQDPHLETCEEFPPAFAYWALWVKNSADAEWEYAMEGVSTLQLGKGQSVGLVFSTNGETPTPSE